MSKNPFELSGSDLLKHSANLFQEKKDGPGASHDSPLKNKWPSNHGAAGIKARADREQSVPEPLDIPEQAEPIEKKAKEPEAKLSDGAWKKPSTRFQEETDVSVKVTLPPGKEHITRVEAELYAKRPSGPELIAKGEGHAQADGIATITLPVYHPTGHTGEPVEYFLAFKHKLAEILKPESLLRKISEVALKSADHFLVPGMCFEKNTSFIRPNSAEGMKGLETRFKEWEKKHPKGKIVVFGHANADEKDPKALSERRGHSAYAFIVNDAEAWEAFYLKEKWGLRILQIIMKDLGHYHGTLDGLDGPATQKALKIIQKQVGVPETGKEDAATRKGLFKAYMQGKHDIKLDANRFRMVAGNPWMGCSHFNHSKEGDDSIPENRRVAFILISESKYFPVYFPCKDGDEAVCQGQCKKPGKRADAGTKCWFYDGLVREDKQAATHESDADELDELMKKPYLEVDEIAKARGLIRNRPTDRQADYYMRLQGKVKYKSQRDNNQSGELADRMCNLTSVAMAFEYLGVKNPEPVMQFEDYLEKVRAEKGYPARTDGKAWEKLAEGMGVSMSSIELMTSDPGILKAKLKPQVEKGCGVVISIFSSESGKGHIVRLQSVSEDGLVVDDPFGKLNNFKQRESGGFGYSGTANTRSTDSRKGEDNLWSWESIGETIIKYADAFSIKE
jgi:outer membrane protein OmpA-like peptidoglycan-associated protein